MENSENVKSDFDLKETLKNATALFKGHILLFLLISFLSTTVYMYFNNISIEELFNGKLFIVLIPFFMSLYILWMTCLFSDIAFSLCKTLKMAANTITENEDDSMIKKIVIFTIMMIFFEFIAFMLDSMIPFDDNLIFYLFSTTNFIACYFAISKTFK